MEGFLAQFYSKVGNNLWRPKMIYRGDLCIFADLVKSNEVGTHHTWHVENLSLNRHYSFICENFDVHNTIGGWNRDFCHT